LFVYLFTFNYIEFLLSSRDKWAADGQLDIVSGIQIPDLLHNWLFPTIL